MRGREPNWLQLSILPVSEERCLVIDRTNGKWVYLPADSIPLVQLLGVEPSDLPENLACSRNELAARLDEVGLGGRPYAAPNDLNSLILKVTKACTYDCAYCYDHFPGESVIHLDPEIAVRAVSEALDLVPRKLGVILHGGEPTLLFDGLIRDLVLQGEEMADERAKEIVFLGQTNLSRLDADFVAFSRDHGIRWGISLDGPPKLNDTFRVLRNGAGTYQYFERALARFPGFVRSCGVMSVITGRNDAHLLEIARHFRDLGLPSWDWSLFHATGQGQLAPSRFQFSVQRLLDSWSELFEAVEAGEFDGMMIRPVTAYLENFLLGPGRNMCLKKDCGAGRDLLSVSCDGSVEGCDCFERPSPYAGLARFTPGAEGVLTEARNTETAAVIRSRAVERGGCSECPWLTLCGGTCLANAEGLHGVWAEQCAVAQRAYSSIAVSLASSNRLERYWRSIDGEGTRPTA